MKFSIFAVGKAKTAHFEPAIAAYQKRLSRWTTLEWKTIPASNKTTESTAILNQIPADSHLVLLDEHGIEWSSPQLAAKIEQLKNRSTQHLVFVIGGAYGVDKTVSDRAQDIWSLSQLVFPHEQVRLILIEQLYRAHDIHAGGNYHHS